jgi:hypothetical protein
MRGFAKLLLGDEAARALDLITGEGGTTGEDGAGDTRGRVSPAEQVRRSGAWCGTTPEASPGAVLRGLRSR